jgi:hypothetical protein
MKRKYTLREQRELTLLANRSRQGRNVTRGLKALFCTETQFGIRRIQKSVANSFGLDRAQYLADRKLVNQFSTPVLRMVQWGRYRPSTGRYSSLVLMWWSRHQVLPSAVSLTLKPAGDCDRPLEPKIVKNKVQISSSFKEIYFVILINMCYNLNQYVL